MMGRAGTSTGPALRLATCMLAGSFLMAGSGPRSAWADATVWEYVRSDDRARSDATLARARRLHERYLATKRDDERRARVFLREELALLVREKAADSPIVALRHALARTQLALHGEDHDARRLEQAIRLLEPIVRDRLGTPVTLRAAALFELAVCHAHLGRRREEIQVYDEALALEPDALHRSLTLANAADARMGLGDLEAATETFREALALLPGSLLPAVGVTTLWGLAVTLDRSGDLPKALEQIALARAFDPVDLQLRSPSWFYVPAREAHWYAALGSWSSARAAADEPARQAALSRVAESYRAYLAEAPGDDAWRPLALVRLAQCEREQKSAEARSLPARRGRSR